MKRMKKILLITGGCLILAGGILFSTGLALGGIPGFAYDQNKIIYYSEKTLGEYIEKKEKLKNIDKLDLDCENIYIEKGTDFRIEYGYYENVEKMEKKEKDGLSIYHMDDIYQRTLSFGSPVLFGDSQRKETYIRVVVPDGVQFETLNAKSDYGNISVESIQSKNMKVDAESGDVLLGKVQIGNSTINMDYGDLELADSSISKMTIDNESGSVNIRELKGDTANLKLAYGELNIDHTVLNELEIKNESGSITLNDVRGITEKKNLDMLTAVSEYGDIRLQEVHTKNMVLESSSGTVRGKNITAISSRIRLDYGDLTLTELKASQSDIINESGSITLGLNKKEKDYRYDLSTDYGEVEINDNSYHQNILKERDGKGLIKALAESGDIKITTAE